MSNSKTNASGSDKLTVLYLNHSGQMSGAESSLRTLLRGLRQSDAPIEPVIALPGEGPFSQTLRDEHWNVTLAPLRRLNRPRGLIDGMTSILHVLQTAPHICRLVDQTHAQIVHSNSTTAHLVGGVAAQKTGKPAIWHCRDLVSLSKIGPQLAAKSAKVIAISNCVAAQLEKDGVPADKIVVVTNGIDTDEWRPRAKSQLRETLNVSDDTFLFGVVGQLVPWKHHADFIEAAAKVVQDEGASKVRFCIIGGDLWGEQQPYVSELRELVKKYDLVDRFNFIPHQSDGIDTISAIDCLVHPALDEPFGRVIMEAMALKKPVIAMDSNGPKEIITHEEDGLLVEPEATDGLAHAMLRVINETDLRAHLSNHSRLAVEQKFQVLDHAQKICDIYRQLL
jgi:glycosyltransferase involved in cell wall biosynthesis